MLLLQLPHKMWTIFLFSTYSLLCSGLACFMCVCVCTYVCKNVYNTFSSLLLCTSYKHILHIVRLRLDEINIYPYSIFYYYVQNKIKTIIYPRVPYVSICKYNVHQYVVFIDICVCFLLYSSKDIHILSSSISRCMYDCCCVSVHSFKIK